MNEQKPVINTQVEDYSGKGGKTVKVAIVLTIILIISAVAMGISVNSMIKQANDSNGKVDHNQSEDTTKSTTVSKVVENFPVEVTETDDMLLFKVTNNKDSVLDLTLRLNLLVGDEVDNTLDDTIIAIEPRYSSYVIFMKEDLGLYEKYEYTVNGINSMYKSVLSSSSDLEKNTSLPLTYDYSNSSDKDLTKVSLICLFYKDGKVVDAKIKSAYGVEEKESISFNDSTITYDKYDAFINEAYYI